MTLARPGPRAPSSYSGDRYLDSLQSRLAGSSYARVPPGTLLPHRSPEQVQMFLDDVQEVGSVPIAADRSELGYWRVAEWLYAGVWFLKHPEALDVPGLQLEALTEARAAVRLAVNTARARAQWGKEKLLELDAEHLGRAAVQAIIWRLERMMPLYFGDLGERREQQNQGYAETMTEIRAAGLRATVRTVTSTDGTQGARRSFGLFEDED